MKYLLGRVCFSLALTLGFALSAQSQTNAQDWIYTTKSGDTLWDLCIEYSNRQGCWIELGKYNAIENDRVIPIGTKIRFPTAWLIVQPSVGRVIGVQGEVGYAARNGDAFVPLTPGQSLVLGSAIQTAEGTARVSLGASINLLIRPNSLLDLSEVAVLPTSATPDSEAESELSLERGAVEVEVDSSTDSRFEIRTPSAIAAVRGTRYRVNSRDEAGSSTAVEVLEGKVGVQAQGDALVPAGFGIVAAKDKPLGEPRALLPAPVFDVAQLAAPHPVVVRWGAEEGAVSWLADISAEGSDSLPASSYALTAPELTLPATLKPDCYQISVRAIDAQGLGGHSGSSSVCVQPPPPVAETDHDREFRISAIITAVFLALALL